jgi:NAD(P)H-dependent FMN reductase
MKLFAIAGSLRKASHNRALLGEEVRVHTRSA